MEHVLGFERYWDVEFHTRDVGRVKLRDGSGLRSVVMWDKNSGLKFANNEPYRPNFKASQINLFNEQHRGDGVQHIALEVRDIMSAVRELRARGVEFMPTPPTYYDALPERLRELDIEAIDESIEALRELELLVDGHGLRSYLLQIFSEGFRRSIWPNRDAGPFFYELIQRKGDSGFGAWQFSRIAVREHRAPATTRAVGARPKVKAECWSDAASAVWLASHIRSYERQLVERAALRRVYYARGLRRSVHHPVSRAPTARSRARRSRTRLENRGGKAPAEPDPPPLQDFRTAAARRVSAGSACLLLARKRRFGDLRARARRGVGSGLFRQRRRRRAVLHSRRWRCAQDAAG